MKIALTPEQERFIEECVSAGRYASTHDVLQEALRLLQERETRIAAEMAELREKIAVGLEQARRGECRDGHEVFEELLARLTKQEFKS